MHKNAINEIKSRIAQIRLEKNYALQLDSVTPTPLEKKEAFPEPLLLSVELPDEIEIPNEEEIETPLEPIEEKEEIRVFEMIDKYKPEALYHVHLDSEIENQLNDVELNKVISILTFNEIGLSRAHGNGIFFFKPETANIKISRKFSKEEEKLPCVKVKPVKEDVRLFGVVEDINGEKHIHLDRISRKAH